MASILVLGKYYPPFMGGIESVTKLYCDALSSSHAVTVIVNSHGGRNYKEMQDGVNVVRLRPHVIIKSQPIALGLAGSFRCGDYDLIHLHGPNPYAAVVLALKWAFSLKKPRLVITHHMDIYGRRLLRGLTMPAYRFLMRRAAWVSVTSRKNFDVSRDIDPRSRVEVIPLSVDLARFNYHDQHKAEALVWRRETFGSSRLVGFVGRHARYKGLDVLIKAIARLPDVQLVLAGDGEFRSELEQLAKNLDIESRVHFPGFISAQEKSRLLLAIDVFAFPSTEITEAFGISQLEAMLHQAPVVASNLPTGVTDVAINEQTALLVPPGDEAALADAITRLLNDPELARRLALCADSHVRDQFADTVVSARFLTLVQRALGDAVIPL